MSPEALKQSTTPKKILMITGWGVGTAPLQPLQEALQHAGHKVQLIDIFDIHCPQQLRNVVELAQGSEVLIGWSLGGQLAWYVAQYILQHTGIAKTVITLASNPCFVQNTQIQPQWLNAMPIEEFQQFTVNFQQDSEQTLKQFYLNICRGSVTAKADWRQLSQRANPPSIPVLATGLKLLQDLNFLHIFQSYPALNHHIFAMQDTLIPCEIIQNIQQISANFSSFSLLQQTSHSFPFTQVEATLQEIEIFLQKV
ncbi:MAG: hydrolase [Acinetobacter sp.]